GKISLYVTAFMFPSTENLQFPSSVHSINSLNKEKGGLVITKSASSLNLVTSELRKSPSPSKYFHWISSILTTPSLVLSSFSKMKILPRSKSVSSSYSRPSNRDSCGV